MEEKRRVKYGDIKMVVLTKSFNFDSHKLIHCVLANNNFVLYALYCDGFVH